MYTRFIILITLLLAFVNLGKPQTIKEQQKRLLSQSRERCVLITTDSGHLTGTIIAKDILLTNFHGLEVDSKLTIFHETNGHIDWQKNAQVIAVDPEKDLALLTAEVPDMSTIKFSTHLELWQEIFYIGYPKGIVQKDSDDKDEKKETPLDIKNMVPGVITALSETRIYSNINPGKGMSGSMLYDMTTGNAIGIQSALIGSQEDNFHSSGAIPSNTILTFLKNTSKYLNDSFNKRIESTIKNRAE